MTFPCGICEKTVAGSCNVVCCDICNKWVNISCNNNTRYCYRKLQKDETPWYCKIWSRQVMLFNNLIEALMLGKLPTSPKLMVSNNQLLFPDNDLENALKSQCLIPNNFYEMQNTTNSKQLYLHLNISSISYHVDDLATPVANCKTKSKVIGISDCRIRIGRLSLLNINIDNYTYEYTPTES